MSDTAKRYQCRHIFTDGRRCGSPCLRQEEFCYYHHTTRPPVENPRQRRRRHSTFELPLPEDRAAIQCSIGKVLPRIARNEIDSKRAGRLLYGLQIASLNLPRNTESLRDSQPVEEITTDPQLGTVAPRAEVGKTEKPLSVVGRLLQNLMNEEKLRLPATFLTRMGHRQSFPRSKQWKIRRLHPRQSTLLWRKPFLFNAAKCRRGFRRNDKAKRSSP